MFQWSLFLWLIFDPLSSDLSFSLSPIIANKSVTFWNAIMGKLIGKWTPRQAGNCTQRATLHHDCGSHSLPVGPVYEGHWRGGKASWGRTRISYNRATASFLHDHDFDVRYVRPEAPLITFSPSWCYINLPLPYYYILRSCLCCVNIVLHLQAPTNLI